MLLLFLLFCVLLKCAGTVITACFTSFPINSSENSFIYFNLIDNISSADNLFSSCSFILIQKLDLWVKGSSSILIGIYFISF